MKPIYKEKYPNLFKNLTVGKGKDAITYKNRVFVGPMAAMVGTDGNGLITENGVQFYADMAQGGYAAICVPIEIPNNGGHPRSVIIDNDELVSFQDMHRLQRLVHAYGCHTSIEIYHAGCCMTPGEGREPISASDMLWNGHQVRGMNVKDMEDVLEMYATAAQYARRAGFESLLLHFGHGWLMNNFLSPLSNKRTDEFGGSVENRCRFPLMVIKRIREVVGNMPIELRLNGSDMVEGGITIPDAVEQALIFAESVDMIHMTCGTRLDASSRPLMHPTHFTEPAHNAEAAKAVKDAFKKAGIQVPVGVIGSVHTPKLAEQLIAEEKVDYVVMARQAIADPDWVNKIREGKEEDIRPCLRCDTCLDSGRRGALSRNVTYDANGTYDSYCAVNVFYNQGDIKKKIPLPKQKKNIAIVGGGISGLQAALTAAERGHDVTLYEKSDKLGGQLFFSDYMWFKKEIKAYLAYMIRQIEKNNVKVLLHTEATPELIEQKNYDAVIVAVGSKPVVPEIPGVEKKHVMLAGDCFGKEDTLGKDVIIIGGGLVGCELSIHLGEKGMHVTVIEMGDFLAANGQLSERMHTMEYMDKAKVESYTNTKCVEILDDGVVVENEHGQQRTIKADTVLLSVGMKSLENERNLFADTAFDVIYVGDCARVGDICTAVNSGFDAAATL